MRRHIHFTTAAIVFLALAGADDLWARGFGGFHAGGIGGFHPGGLGGFHPGGLGGGLGAFHPGGAGGFHPGGVGGGGLHGLNPGGFGGLGANRFGAGGLGAGRFGEGGLGAGGDRLGADGLGERAPTRGGLNSFLGLPSDAGLHSVRRGVARGPLGGVAAGGRIEGPHGGEVGRGVAVGPRGNVAGGRFAEGPGGNAVWRGFAAGPRGMRSILAARLSDGAMAVRRNFHGHGLYSAGWYRRYPGAWYATGWAAGYAWRAATWDSLDDWFDYGDDDPIYYNYGTNVVYQDNNVYINGQEYGTAQQYYDQAQDLADAGAKADAPADEKWMPLGVFALTKPDHTSANMDLQLAVNKAGIIRGNYTNTVSQQSQPINGSVDKKTQRACWTVGKNSNTVMETGLYNLTKDQAPALIHFGADRTEQWMLVRIKQQSDQQPTSQEN